MVPLLACCALYHHTSSFLQVCRMIRHTTCAVDLGRNHVDAIQYIMNISCKYCRMSHWIRLHGIDMKKVTYPLHKHCKLDTHIYVTFDSFYYLFYFISDLIGYQTWCFFFKIQAAGHSHPGIQRSIPRAHAHYKYLMLVFILDRTYLWIHIC